MLVISNQSSVVSFYFLFFSSAYYLLLDTCILFTILWLLISGLITNSQFLIPNFSFLKLNT